MRQPRVEFFDVTCRCGRTISGQRLARPQAVECPDCGEGLFVLPVDVYPPASLVRRGSAWRHSTRPGARSVERWSVLGFVASAGRFASGRLLLMAILATMTASLLFAFWIDAQSRRNAESAAPATARPARAAGASMSAPRAALTDRAIGPDHVLTGRVQDGAILIDEPGAIPDGTRVSIRIIPATAERSVLIPGEAAR